MTLINRNIGYYLFTKDLFYEICCALMNNNINKMKINKSDITKSTQVENY